MDKISHTSKSGLEHLFQIVAKHETKMNASFSLVPSENLLSPASKDVLTSDMYSRYFFDDDRLWGNWAFQGGRQVGEIQETIIVPILQRLTSCDLIVTKPVSGLSCMMLALSSYCEPGDEILCLSGKLGGHSSTSYVAERLGLKVNFIDPISDFDFDEEWLSRYLRTENVKLIYIDQANNLFPIDVEKLKRCINASGKETYLHVDASHINGLIFGGVLDNPVKAGADSFGGSLHKTFPGPHKGFIATNNAEIHARIKNAAAHLISHSHSSDTLALAAALVEFEECGGAEYSQQIVTNAIVFAGTLEEGGLKVAKRGHEYTRTHQVWVANSDGRLGNNFSDRLYQVGLLVNSFGGLPIFPEGGLRIGLNEPTRLGVKEDDSKRIANCLLDVLNGKNARLVESKVQEIRACFDGPKYCFNEKEKCAIRGGSTVGPLARPEV